MRFVIFLSLSIFATVGMAQYQQNDLFDNIDIDAVLNNHRLYQVYLDCLLDRRPCVDERGRTLRKLFPEAITNNCASCTEKQKVLAKKVGCFVADNRPEDWKLIQAKYDPYQQHAEKVNAFIRS